VSDMNHRLAAARLTACYQHTGHRTKKWGCRAAQLRAAFEATGSIMADSAPKGANGSNGQ